MKEIQIQTTLIIYYYIVFFSRTKYTYSPISLVCVCVCVCVHCMHAHARLFTQARINTTNNVLRYVSRDSF